MRKLIEIKLVFFICLMVSNVSALSANQDDKPLLKKIGVFACGKQPKQVLFSPDNEYILLPLLDDDGVDVFSVKEKKVIKRLNPPHKNEKGFAEGLFIPEKKSFFVSQMTTGMIYEYSYPDFNFKRQIETHGTWSKFIAFSKEKNLLAVSNWVSNDISLIDYEAGKLIRKIKTGLAPRGIIFLKNGEEIVSLSFESGVIEKFNVDSGNKISEIKIEKAAMRHISVNNDKSKAYVSDMYHRCVYEINLQTFAIERKAFVFNNPNTIALHKDRFLFVSCRGPNDPTDYTKRSPVNGKIVVIDTKNFSIIYEIEGGNQPTGLDVSSDGTKLCFSDFQDAAIELYELN